LITVSWENKTPLSAFELFKLYTYTLLKSKNYLYMQSMNETLIHNRNLNYDDIKNITLQNIEERKREDKNKKKEKEKTNFTLTKSKKILTAIWLIYMIALIICIFNRRFENVNFGFGYYSSLVIIYICFWTDLMKIKNVENKYDFGVYMFIYLFMILVIILYSNTFNNDRLSELAFAIPIFIYSHIKAFKKPFPNILVMPFLTKKNFFGLDPNNYNNMKNKKQS
jgi:uncharacterized membrane protein